MSKIGSSEWFNEESKKDFYVEEQQIIEERRAGFLARFSPEMLKALSGEELLYEVFEGPQSMMHLLMYNKDIRRFGAAGTYKYTGIIYNVGNKKWRYKEGKIPIELSEEEAAKKANLIIDKLIFCVEIIENTTINSISDYSILRDNLSNVFFSNYTWCLKYFQMLFPQYFPGMYSDDTIERALGIIGLPFHGRKARLVNIGEISLFIRKCDVNNITFNNIYSHTWGWDGDKPPCESAEDNYNDSKRRVETLNTDYYKIKEKYTENELDRYELVEKIDEGLLESNLLGEERLAVVKTRVNQSAFRDNLLQKYHKCCLCGVSAKAFLRASHIKPWSVSTPKEKTNVNNGLLLCPNHDIAFDGGYISFDGNGKIMISKELSDNDRIFLNIRSDMGIKLNDEIKQFMDYHRNNVFRDNNEETD